MENISGTHPSPTTPTHQRGVASRHDCHPAAAGKHHAPPPAGK